MQNALNESFSADVPVRFETAGDGICGIELTANGQKVGWTIAGYLKALDLKVGALLDAEVTLPVEATPKTDSQSIQEAVSHNGVK